MGPLVPMAGETYEPPGVHSFEPRLLFPDVPWLFWLNNFVAQAIISVIIILAFWLWVSNKAKIVPSKRQFIGEFAYDMVRNGIGREALGPEYRRYTPYLVALFSFLLVNNLFGQFFLFMLPTFSQIGFAYGLALLSYLLFIGAGLARHGIKYFKIALIPSGVPWWLIPLILPLELISNFIVRPLTLALRLFANLFAGHLVILVFVAGGGWLIQYADTTFNRFAGGISILFGFPVFALELLVGTLQAYIFTVLTAQYVASAVAEDH
ncbi:F0F1 ATP synthase subunit A [Parenemella sanctibonifatiensis]|nr:F0F1 ATP synthase subunit A [Parenemella sanctibonifatiensis]